MPAPVGELVSIGISKETTFAQAVAPATFHEVETFNPATKNMFIPRTGSRRSLGQRKKTTGPIDLSASFRPGATPDTLFQMIAFAMGAQTAPALVSGSTSAYGSTLSFGTSPVLPSFTLEYNRVTDAIDLVGCTIESMKLAMDSGQGLKADFSLVAATELLKASPVAPTFSSKNFIAMESIPSSSGNQLNGQAIGVYGSGLGVALLKWDLTLANQLEKNYRGQGSGRQVYGFPIGARTVSGSMTLGFESNAAYLLFWGAATGPAPVVPAVPLQLAMGSQDFADASKSLYYQAVLTMPNVYIDQGPVASTTTGSLKQVVNFSATELLGNDDLTIALQTTTATAF